MENEQKKIERLCSEIQLFDLCDKDVCSHKNGRYCTKGDILTRFEAILDKDDERSPEQFMADELDGEGAEDLGYDDAYGDEYDEEEDFDDPEDDIY